MSGARSLLLVTVDCLRADHTGFLGYERPTTPFLDSIAKRSFVFRNAIAAGVPTYYSFPAIMASRYPLALGRDVVGLAPEEATLTQALRESGYSTGAFLAGNPYLSRRFGYETGFDTFEDFLDMDIGSLPQSPDSSPSNGHWRRRINRALERTCHDLGPLGPIYDELYFRYCQRVSDRRKSSFDSLRRFPAAHLIVDHALDWLGGTGKPPFFLWLHFMDPHAPYYPSPEAFDLLDRPRVDTLQARHLNSFWNRRDLSRNRLQTRRDEMLGLYDAGIRWVDAQIGRLLNELEPKGLLKNCVMAFTADHGEEFLDHGGAFHSPSKVNEELSHVPLLLHVPDHGGAKSVNSPFGLLDLAPTLLDILDVPAPLSFRGQSRWSRVRNAQSWEDPTVTECVTTCTNPFHLNNRLGARILGVREERYKLILDCNSPRELLFDLRDDPGELRPLPSNAEKPVRRRLLDRARRHLVDSLQSRDSDARLAARLRDLGQE